jgi:ribosomal protein L22
MARKANYEVLENKIETTQAKVIKSKTSYDAAVNELQKLLDKRDAIRKDEIWPAIITSEKSYEEVLKLIRGKTEE